MKALNLAKMLLDQCGILIQRQQNNIILISVVL